MCEWLSTAAWCDVQLVCRGRVFSAHRAVLASVSAFLRKILLSCHEEIAPTSIILPDFDLRAMFSVLYYIYNGEVVVPSSTIESFLDIIVTLEIFVDKQILTKIQENSPDLDVKFEKIYTNNPGLEEMYNSKSTFKLGFSYDEELVTIRKERAHISPASVGCGDQIDTVSCVQVQRQRPYLENIHSRQEGRQKKSFLRDSFTETYPRSGLSNGPAGRVPVISNEPYLDTTSAHLMNANCKSTHLLTPKLELTRENLTPVEAVFSKSNMPMIVSDIQSSTTSLVCIEPTKDEHDYLPHPPSKVEKSAFANVSKILNSTCAYSLSAYSYNSLKTAFNLELAQSVDTVKGRGIHKSNVGAKTAISNQVMQSPWSPRLPISYRPFRKKLQQKELPNDKNNNVESVLTDVDSKDASEARVKTGVIDTKPAVDPSITESKCEVCKQVFPDPATLSQHAKTHSAPARFTCTECGKTFSQLRNYKYHMSVHRGTKEFAATCTVCGKYFNDRGYLSSHMKIHRNRKEYKCQLCPKSFNQRVAYNMHVRIHTGVKPHVCEQCGKAFSRKMLLKQHARTHSGERPYACTHCDKRFADRSNMTLHLRLHTGVKPFSCTLCPKSFTKKHHLKSHLNYHTGAKPYSCPRCHLAFTQSSNMRTHMKKCNVKGESSS
ncbi:hypothetical protein JYU34_016468 [Plutella xylostella]|uniref:Zinc finger protein n=1 Tax=Plutella xylostella TaxID=51655 RepID=A0ABQ7Q2V7_PLUXY|nr:hypothetical protein JYU34_016468 [Plutella xylostella]